MGPSGEKGVHGNTYPLLMNQDQKGRIDNLFRSILVFHGQFVDQRDLGSIDDGLQVEINRLGMNISRLYPELTNMGIAELVRPLLRLLDYFNTYSQDQTLSLFEAIKSSSSYRGVDYPGTVFIPHEGHAPVNNTTRLCQTTCAATLSSSLPDDTSATTGYAGANAAGTQVDTQAYALAATNDAIKRVCASSAAIATSRAEANAIPARAEANDIRARATIAVAQARAQTNARAEAEADRARTEANDIRARTETNTEVIRAQTQAVQAQVTHDAQAQARAETNKTTPNNALDTANTNAQNTLIRRGIIAAAQDYSQGNSQRGISIRDIDSQNKLPGTKVGTIMINAILFSVLGYRKIGNGEVQLSLSRKEADGKERFRVADVEESSIGEGKNIKILRWHDSTGEHSFQKNGKPIDAIQRKVETIGSQQRKPISEYLNSVTLNYPVTIKTRYLAKQKDYTVIESRKIGERTYDVAMSGTEDNGKITQRKCRVHIGTSTDGQESLTFVGQYDNSGKFLSFGNSVMHTIDSVQLGYVGPNDNNGGWLRKLWNNGIKKAGALVGSIASSISTGPRTGRAPSNQISRMSRDKPNEVQSEKVPTDSINPNKLGLYNQIKGAISKKDIIMKVRINGETKVISIKTDSTNERSEYYRFGISYGNDNETSTIHIPKKSLDAISVDNLSLSFGAAGSTQLGIMSIDRLIIGNNAIIDIKQNKKEEPTPPPTTSLLNKTIQSTGNAINKAGSWVKKLFGRR